MKFSRIVTRSLFFYWKTGVAVALGVAVAAAVIVGSVIVSGSVTGSIRDTALGRLGRIDHALVAQGRFRWHVADGLRRPPLSDRLAQVAEAVIRRGSVTSDKTGATVPNVTVIGVDDDFWRFYADGKNPGLSERLVAVNSALARDLGLAAGDAAFITIGRAPGIPSDTLFASSKLESTALTRRVQVAAVVPDERGGGFALDASTGTPRNLFASRGWLARQLGPEHLVNAILISSKNADDDVTADAAVREALKSGCELDDYGLRLVPNRPRGYVSVETESLVLSAPQVAAALDAASACKARAARTSVYLADAINRSPTDRADVVYSVVAGYEPLAELPLKRGWVPTSGDDIIYLNTWAEARLRAKVGDRIVVSYRVPERDGTYRTRTAPFTLHGIVDIAGPAADRGLVPEFKGVTDAKTLRDWDPPFPIEKERITRDDEEYWKKDRATPKAFIPLAAARAMWAGTGGGNWITSVRVTPPAGKDLDQFRAEFEGALLGALSPDDAGLVFRPVRRQALAAAGGSTDFGVLFFCMGLFLVVAGIGLAAMLMRLSIERRASEAGTLLACGFTPRAAGSAALAEGAVLALAGALLGVPLGILYAAGVLEVLRAWSAAALGEEVRLWLHADAVRVVLACVAILTIALAFIWLAVRRLRRMPVLQLLSGSEAIAARPAGKTARLVAHAIAVSSLACAAALLILGTGAGPLTPAAAFFGGGAALLIGMLSALYLALARALAWRSQPRSIVGLALRNVAAHRGRSLLIVALLTSASFILVTVAANQRDVARMDPAEKHSGTGGFALRALSSLPLPYDFGTRTGRENLKFADKDERAFGGTRVFSLLYSSGEDISCLNLARASRPNVLGVTPPFIRRGGFTVNTLGGAPGNPWQALEQVEADGAVPAFADAQTLTWQLHSGLGRTMTIDDESGRAVDVRFVGTLASCVLAGEIIVSEANFRRLFPSESAPRYFLIEAPPGAESSVATALRRNLGGLGLDVRGTREILASLASVQNTYLATFMALGGLGALMGTLGLVVVILRSALERRRELALMLAVGFARRRLAALLALENGGLVVCGVVAGSAAALIATAPQLRAVESHVDWVALSALLLGMIVLGVGCCVVTALGVVRTRLIEALRTE